MSIFKKIFSKFWSSNRSEGSSEELVVESYKPSKEDLRQEAEGERRKKKLQDDAISKSQDNIKVLNALHELAKNTIYADKFKKVFDLVTDIHNKIMTDDKLNIGRLTSFHSYKVNEFIIAYDTLLEPLRPKEEVPEHLLAGYKLDKDEPKEEEVVLEPKDDSQFGVTKFNIKEYIKEHIDELSNKESKSLSELKILIALSVYQYIKQNDSISYNIDNNKEVDFSDIQTFEDYILFLRNNSDISKKTIYIASSKNKNPVLFDMKSYQAYEYDYVSKTKISTHDVIDSDLMDFCEKCY